MKRWRKIKVTNEGKVYLEWQEKRPQNQWDDFTLQCTDQGKPEFYDAFKALAEHVVEMCELPADDLLDMRVTVKGVTFSYGGERETMGATISATRKLKKSNSPLTLVTPHKPVEPYSEGQERDVNGMLTDDCIDALKELVAQAQRYLDGDRLQVDLFAETVTPVAEVATA